MACVRCVSTMPSKDHAAAQGGICLPCCCHVSLAAICAPARAASRAHAAMLRPARSSTGGATWAPPRSDALMRRLTPSPKPSPAVLESTTARGRRLAGHGTVCHALPQHQLSAVVRQTVHKGTNDVRAHSTPERPVVMPPAPLPRPTPTLTAHVPTTLACVYVTIRVQ